MPSRGTVVGLLVLLALAIGLTACAGIGSSASPTATSSGQVTGVQAGVIGTDFAVGRNRFTFTLVNNGQPVTDAKPMVYFFALQGFNALPGGHSAAAFETVGTSGGGGPSTGIYVTHTTFDRAGKWGAEIDLQTDLQSGGKTRSLQAIFAVSAHSVTPAVGTAAPRSHNPTVSQEPVSKLDSGKPPDDMHSVSIADAIARHRPLVVLFASAAYCGDFQCGAEIAALKSVEHRFRGAADFVHIDVFRNARPSHLAATAVQWHIQSQPWVFIVDRHGIIAAKFEGPASAGELETALIHASH